MLCGIFFPAESLLFANSFLNQPAKAPQTVPLTLSSSISLSLSLIPLSLWPSPFVAVVVTADVRRCWDGNGSFPPLLPLPGLAILSKTIWIFSSPPFSSFSPHGSLTEGGGACYFWEGGVSSHLSLLKWFAKKKDSCSCFCCCCCIAVAADVAAAAAAPSSLIIHVNVSALSP